MLCCQLRFCDFPYVQQVHSSSVLADCTDVKAANVTATFSLTSRCCGTTPACHFCYHKRSAAGRRGGIDVAERLWRDVLKDVRKTSDLEVQHARLRLEQVLETYTDITRFPPYAHDPSHHLWP